jgi:hypothetical protein
MARQTPETRIVRVRRFTRALVFIAAFALVAAACGDDSTPLTFDGYVAEMRAIGDDFLGEDQEQAEPLSEAPDEYPIGGDLVGATELYTAYENLLDDWRNVGPPPELVDLHTELVDALDVLQRDIGDYLMDEALEGGDFHFATIGAKIGRQLHAAESACKGLHQALAERGAGPVFGDCTF